MNLTQEQKEKLGIIDERVDFYFKVENAVVDGYVVEEINLKTGKLETVEKSYFDNVYEFAVFTVLSRYCNNGQVAFPSIATLTKKCCCGKSSVNKAIKSLERKGFIKKVTRKKPNSQEKDSNAYAIKNIEQIIRVDRVATEVGCVATNVGCVATNVGCVATSKKNKLIKNKLIINHDKKKTTLDKTLDVFENLFKEFGVNFTKTNQASVKVLLKTMSEKEVIEYLRETYTALKENKSIKSIARAFTAKIQKGERQINSKPKVEKTNNPIISTEEKRLSRKEKINYIKTILSDEKLEKLMEEAKQTLITTGISLSENNTLLTEYESLLMSEYNKMNRKKEKKE